MIKRFLPLIFASVCLMATPVYAAEPVDAIVPVSCSAEGSTESFAVSIEGDSGFKALRKGWNLEMAKVKRLPYKSIFLVIINIKSIRKKE